MAEGAAGRRCHTFTCVWLTDNDRFVRREAAKALVKLGQPRGLTAVVNHGLVRAIAQSDRLAVLDGPRVVRREDLCLNPRFLDGVQGDSVNWNA